MGDYQLEGYQAFFNSVGPGKGIACYVKESLRLGEAAKFTDAKIQLVKIAARRLEVINIYRSQDEALSSAAFHLRDLLEPETDTLIIGDLNVCASQPNPLRNFLEGEGFHQLVTLPTHIQGGSLWIIFSCFAINDSSTFFYCFAIALIPSCQVSLTMHIC